MRNLGLICFDADSTLRDTTIPGKHFPTKPGEWVLRANVKERIAKVDWNRVGFGVASNQGGVARGMLSEVMAKNLLVDMAKEAFSLLPELAGIFLPHMPKPFIQLCPHNPDDRCSCRKPMPGMLTRIMAWYDVPPSRTLFVGNADTDQQAANNAGCLFQWESEFFA